jgi:ribosomal protein S18 acetylase RimI-like enzyme
MEVKTQVVFRQSRPSDLDKMYELHKLCFKQSDQWYKAMFQQFTDKALVIERESDKEMLAFLLQGPIIPCDSEEDGINFIPQTPNGTEFKRRNLHLSEVYGIVLLCVHPNYRGKGLAQKLITKHILLNPNRTLCLNTRRSNPAYYLYLKMGYEHIGVIKEKYYQPTEDSMFMIIKS